MFMVLWRNKDSGGPWSIATTNVFESFGEAQKYCDSPINNFEYRIVNLYVVP